MMTDIAQPHPPETILRLYRQLSIILAGFRQQHSTQIVSHLRAQGTHFSISVNDAWSRILSTSQ